MKQVDLAIQSFIPISEVGFTATSAKCGMPRCITKPLRHLLAYLDKFGSNGSFKVLGRGMLPFIRAMPRIVEVPSLPFLRHCVCSFPIHHPTHPLSQVLFPISSQSWRLSTAIPQPAVFAASSLNLPLPCCLERALSESQTP